MLQCAAFGRTPIKKETPTPLQKGTTTPIQQDTPTPVWQGKGRILVSCDGNEHDDDDWGATPMTLALLAARGLQDRVPVYVYSDHVWGSSQERGICFGMTSYEHMRESALKGKEYFGFDNTRFICAVDNPEVAYKAVADEINKCTADDPLIIIAAGPLQVIGEGINRADADKLQYVSLISHGRWNNIHAENPDGPYWDRHHGWTWDALQAQFGDDAIATGGVTFIMPADQNGGKDYDGLQSDKTNFDWILTSPARKNPAYKHDSWNWLYSRMVVCIRPDGRCFDVSDAGMVIFMLTGIEKTNPAMAREIMENPVEN